MELIKVLINTNDGKFTYAAIFCAMTTLIGICVCVAPVGMGWFADYILAKRAREASSSEKGKRQEREVENPDDKA